MAEPDFLSDPDLRESSFLRGLLALTGGRLPPRLIARLARRLEGGDAFSLTLRRLLWRRYRVRAEAMSYGAFHEPNASPPGLVVGRYASVANDVVWGMNHPTDRIAMSSVFYLARFGFTQTDLLGSPALQICADAWIGAKVVITPGCRRIGIGAVVGAGSVVTRDVPDFAIVFGSPARLARHRFDEETQRAILASRWWERSPRDLAPLRAAFLEPVTGERALAALAELAATAPSRG